MPIYAYRCSDCGFQQDMLRKISDPPLTLCPSCGHDSFSKQLSAPAFQLKGTGWYVTDFRDNGKKPAENQGGKGAGEADAAQPAKASGDSAAAAPSPAPAAAAPAAASPAAS